MTSDTSNVLMIYPRFNPKSFWGYEGRVSFLVRAILRLRSA
jgi:hypothetical protein